MSFGPFSHCFSGYPGPINGPRFDPIKGICCTCPYWDSIFKLRHFGNFFITSSDSIVFLRLTADQGLLALPQVIGITLMKHIIDKQIS